MRTSEECTIVHVISYDHSAVASVSPAGRASYVTARTMLVVLPRVSFTVRQAWPKAAASTDNKRKDAYPRTRLHGCSGRRRRTSKKEGAR